MNIPPPVLETVALTKLVPWPGNPRVHHDAQDIARSIEKLGYLAPIIVQKGTYRVLAGHGRLKALQHLGVVDVPVIVADLDDTKAGTYLLADNRLAELSEWDRELLPQLVKQLQELEADLTLAGFDDEALRELLDAEVDAAGKSDEDLEIEPQREAVTQLHDVWNLGDHSIVCGDATDPMTWKLGPCLSMIGEGRKASVVFTDPPYGVDYKAKKFDLIANDELKGDALAQFLTKVFVYMARTAEDTAAFYVWHASATREDFAYALKAAGLIERQYLIWVKPGITLGHADYQWQHEPCFYAAKDGRAPAFHGDRTQATVWQAGIRRPDRVGVALGQGLILSSGDRQLYVTASPPKSRRARRLRLAPDQQAQIFTEVPGGDCWHVGRDSGAEHPTQKPVELVRRALLNSSLPGQVVLDPFLGSGSTLIGAELTGRICWGIELSPAYVDVAVRRWQRITGKRAENFVRKGVVID